MAILDAMCREWVAIVSILFWASFGWAQPKIIFTDDDYVRALRQGAAALEGHFYELVEEDWKELGKIGLEPRLAFEVLGRVQNTDRISVVSKGEMRKQFDVTPGTYYYGGGDHFFLNRDYWREHISPHLPVRPNDWEFLNFALHEVFRAYGVSDNFQATTDIVHYFQSIDQEEIGQKEQRLSILSPDSKRVLESFEFASRGGRSSGGGAGSSGGGGIYEGMFRMILARIKIAFDRLSAPELAELVKKGFLPPEVKKFFVGREGRYVQVVEIDEDGGEELSQSTLYEAPYFRLSGSLWKKKLEKKKSNQFRFDRWAYFEFGVEEFLNALNLDNASEKAIFLTNYVRESEAKVSGILEDIPVTALPRGSSISFIGKDLVFKPGETEKDLIDPAISGDVAKLHIIYRGEETTVPALTNPVGKRTKYEVLIVETVRFDPKKRRAIIQFESNGVVTYLDFRWRDGGIPSIGQLKRNLEGRAIVDVANEMNFEEFPQEHLDPSERVAVDRYSFTGAPFGIFKMRGRVKGRRKIRVEFLPRFEFQTGVQVGNAVSNNEGYFTLREPVNYYLRRIDVVIDGERRQIWPNLGK